jgi:hypothetical protein
MSELFYLNWFTVDFVVHSVASRTGWHGEVMDSVVKELMRRGLQTGMPVGDLFVGVQTRLRLYAAAVNEAEGSEMLLSIGRVFARLCGGGEDAGLEDLAAIVFSATHISALPLLKSAMEK